MVYQLHVVCCQMLGMICTCVLFCRGRRRDARHYVGLNDAEEAE